MAVVIILGLFTVFSAWLESIGKYKHGIKLSFILIFIFMSLRYNYGSDYHEYLNLFNEINRYSSIIISDQNSNHVELGWIFLNRVFKPFGFFILIAILSFFYCYSFGRLIINYGMVKWYWLSLFMLILTPYLMLIPISGMRQGLACLFFIISLKFVFKRSLIAYLICILIASQFHLSALVLLPVYFLYNISYSSKLFSFILISSYIFITLFGEKLLPTLNEYTQIIFLKYTNDYGLTSDNLSTNLPSALFRFVPFVAAVLLRSKQDNRINLFFINLFILSYLVVQLTVSIPILSRLDMYLGISSIIVIPLIFDVFWKNILGRIFCVLFVANVFKGFFLFFSHEIWKASYATYHTIFEVLT